MELLIPKKTGTYADALCAIGYASLFSDVRGSTARLVDQGHAYQVSCPSGRPVEDWPAPSAGFLYICRRSKEDWPPASEPIMDYEVEQQIADAAKKTEKKKSSGSGKARKKVEAALEELSETPAPANSPEYRFAAIIESMRKGWASDKSLFRWIAENPKNALATTKSRLQGGNESLDADWSNSQILNPSTGKGVHASKTIAKSAGGFNLVDSFDEWMKLRGLWRATLAFRSGDDFKFFVIDPGDISTAHLEMLRRELRDLGMWGVVRLDIEAVLRLLQSLLLHSDGQEEEGIPLFGRNPRQVIRGLQLAFFKSLGTAAALMNDSLLPLPDWFTIKDQEDFNAYLAICKEPFGAKKGEHGPLSALRDDRSDDVELLQKYRRWLTSGELSDLLEFHVSFAPHLLRRTSAGDFAPAFKVEVLHVLLSKGYPLVKEIIESSGFQSIAKAIRHSTTRAVWEKQQKRPNAREIRFGLAQRMKQRIKAGDKEFLAELSDFVQQQNWEVVHRLGGKGHQVSDSDLDDIVHLTEKYKAELVGMLLLAYGFARAEPVSPKEIEVAETATA